MRFRIFRAAAMAAFSVPIFCSSLLCQSFSDRWSHVSETSAAVYWRDGAIGSASISWVEYGNSPGLGASTDSLRRPRWAHLHHLTGLTPGDTCYYRMVALDTLTGLRGESPLLTLLPARRDSAVRIPQDVQGPPYILDRPGAYYVLTTDITASGNAIQITAADITLDLDGHTVTFGDDTDEQVFGVRFSCQGASKLCNGRIVQGRRSGDYSCAIRSNSRPYPTEICGISTDVRLRCAYPVNFHTQAVQLDFHHNHLQSRVVEIESRHYPGNAILRVVIGSGGGIHIHDNLLTEGCHRGIMLYESGPDVEIDHNDIQHHMQFVNGYAINTCQGAVIHHNRITSTGRGIHLTEPDVRVHDNYLDLKGHVDLDDLPSGSRPFQLNYIELHGIKFEGSSVTGCKVYDNFVRIVQRLPVDSDGQGDPLDKIDNGVYVRSSTGSASGNDLADPAQKWEAGRWTGYYLKYSPDLPPVQIYGNTENSLTAYMTGAASGPYSIYMKWNYVPPTPLNIACYNPDAGNEVYGNTFVALTEYATTRHGAAYGDAGQWASPVMFISMDKGPASGSGYSIRVSDNRFITNDLFLNSDGEVNMTVRFENNRFELAGTPRPTERESRIRAVGAALEGAVSANGNTFTLESGSLDPDINRDSRLSLSDVVKYLILALSQPVNPALDFNGDGRAGTADAVLLVREIFRREGAQGTALSQKD